MPVVAEVHDLVDITAYMEIVLGPPGLVASLLHISHPPKNKNRNNFHVEIVVMAVGPDGRFQLVYNDYSGFSRSLQGYNILLFV